MRQLLPAGLLLLICNACFTTAGYGGMVTIDAGTAVTTGRFSFQDITVDMSREIFNPFVSVEYRFSGTEFSIGLLYAGSQNRFELDYNDGDLVLTGSIDAERREFLPYVRFGKRDRSNFRFGYRMFNYTFSNGELDEIENDILTKLIRSARAEGRLSSGFDAELNMVFGDVFQFDIMIGGTYFFDAEYEWEYNNILTDSAVQTGGTDLEAASIRVAPGFNYRIGDSLRLFGKYRIQATSWMGSGDDVEEYAGRDIMTAIVIGARYSFNW
jgi:hypothetical protein